MASRVVVIAEERVRAEALAAAVRRAGYVPDVRATPGGPRPRAEAPRPMGMPGLVVTPGAGASLGSLGVGGYAPAGESAARLAGSAPLAPLPQHNLVSPGASLAREGASVVLAALEGALLAQVAREWAPVPVVAVVPPGPGGEPREAGAAFRAGAFDVLAVAPDGSAADGVLEGSLARAAEHLSLREEVARLHETEERPGALAPQLVGSSPPLLSATQLVERVADSDASVLITGESGTGKELAAQALHQRSRRREGPFIAISCAAMPEPLLESELFGHSKGAFTDAKQSRAGLFVRANGGTLFLDELGEMPLGLQPKLLRALQARRVRPVGSDTEVPFDARIVAATHRDLETAVQEGRFRQDLYFRVNVIGIELPPLRARGRDVLLLAQRFLEQFAARSGKDVRGLSPGASAALLAYAWPGNVRELQNCIERAVALSATPYVQRDDLPERVLQPRPLAPAPPPLRPASAAAGPGSAGTGTDAGGGELLSLDELERRHILRVLEVCRGSRSAAARILGVDRKTLYRKLSRYAREAAATR